MAAVRRKAEAKTWPRRGEIYLTALDPTVGHESVKRGRLSSFKTISRANTDGRLLSRPVTSTVPFPLSPVHVLIAADSRTGLSVPSVVLLNQIRVVDRRRLVKRLGQADEAVMRQVDEAIKISFGLAL